MRIVVLLVVVPVRMVWDLLVVCGRAVDRVLLRPLGRALAWLFENVLTPLGLATTWLAVFIGKALFVWPWVALWRYVVVPVVTYGLVVPLVWIYRQLLTPLGHGIAWLVEHLLVAPAGSLHRRLLTPLGHGVAAVLAWLGRALFVWPWVALWRYVVVPVVTYGLVVPLVWIYRQLLTPLGHGIAWLLRHRDRARRSSGRGWGWAVCGGACGDVRARRARRLDLPAHPRPRRPGDRRRLRCRLAHRRIYLARRRPGAEVARLEPGRRPVRWFYRTCAPRSGTSCATPSGAPAKKAAVEAGRAVRGALATARETVRQARAATRGARSSAGPRPASQPVEPGVRQARTLGSTTTVPGAAADPEISLHKRG